VILSSRIHYGVFHALAKTAKCGFDGTDGAAWQWIAQAADRLFVYPEPWPAATLLQTETFPGGDIRKYSLLSAAHSCSTFVHVRSGRNPSPNHQPSRSGCLLTLVRKLINYGREIATIIREHTTAQPIFAKVRSGTTDLALIFTRIAHGLLLANALEARVLQRAAHLDTGPRRGRARCAPRAPAAPRAAEPADAGLAHLPTAEQIAAEVRRRPIGAVIADICRDLGILPSHPLWPDVARAMLEYGGSPARLVSDLIDRAFSRPPPTVAPAALLGPNPRFETPGGTGPP
jgi:hypothetical protein